MAKIFINPGHCPGVDPGACHGNLTEADIARNISELVEHYLINAGCECRLLQSDNLCGESPSYPDICQTANDWGADLFVSIHCNSASPAAQGTEVLVYSVDSPAGVLADCIQAQIVDSLGTFDRGVKARTNLAVLKYTAMSAVLVELAFLSNDCDRSLLVNNQDDFARAVARGVTDYLCYQKEV